MDWLVLGFFVVLSGIMLRLFYAYDNWTNVEKGVK